MGAAACLSWMIAVLPSGSIYESRGRCDLVEVNHCHDPETGQLKYTQVIAWDRSPQYRRFDAQQWAMISDWKRNEFDVVVDVASSDQIIRIRCDYFRETWTRHDPERQNLELFAEKYRRRVW
jgi:hypothetical protein